MAKAFNKWEKVGTDRVRVMGGPEPKPKKITATRLSAILGYDHWNTDFQRWCEICRVAESTFTDNKYTVTGKIVEPRLHDFCLEYISPNLKRPADMFKNVDRVWDFYPKNAIFGGKWDDLVCDRKGNKIGIVEYKTSSRPQDWQDGPPANYALQALLYGVLEGVDDIWLVVAFLEPDDYVDPDDYANINDIKVEDCTFTATEENVRIFPMKVSDGLNGQSMEELVGAATTWWETHVIGNVSPTFDEKKDKEYLDIMRKNVVELPNDLAALSAQVAALDDRIAAEYAKIPLAKELEKERKELVDKVFKVRLKELLEDGKTIIETAEYKYARAKSGTQIDTAALKADGLLEKYTIEKEGSWTLTRKKKEA